MLMKTRELTIDFCINQLVTEAETMAQFFINFLSGVNQEEEDEIEKNLKLDLKNYGEMKI